MVGCNRSGEGFLWDVKTRKLVTKLTNGSDIREIAFSPDSERIVSKGIESFFTLWDARTGNELITLPLNAGPEISPLSDSPFFSPDGRQLVSAGADGVLRIWHSLPWKDQPKAARK
jgi:WD40 repeat protein